MATTARSTRPPGPAPLRLGLLPGESPAAVRERHEPLRVCCEQLLGRPVELVVGRSYSHTSDALRRGEIDAAYLGPVAYILLNRAAGGQVLYEPFARPTHGGAAGPTFRAVVIGSRRVRRQTLADLRGRELAFGDHLSTSGHWVPRHMLLGAGLVADRDYVRRHLGGHDAVAAAVAAGEVAAGGLSLAVYQRLLDEGRLSPADVVVLAESEAIPEYMWTFGRALDAPRREALREAFLALRDDTVLAAYRARSFIPAVDPDVDRVRHWMESILQARLHERPIAWQANEAAIGWEGAVAAR